MSGTNDIKMKINLDATDANKDLEKINKNLDKTGKELNDVGVAAKKTSGGFGSMGKSIKGIGVALKGAGIGLILSILAALFSLLKENQAVMDFFNKATYTMKVLFNDLLGVLEPVKEALTNAFKNPKQAVIDLWEVIKENMINRVKGMIDFFTQSFSGLVNVIKGTGLAIKGIFDDEAKQKSKEYFDAAKKDAADAAESFVQMGTGVDHFIDKAKAFGKAVVDEFGKAITIADDYVEKQNELILKEAELNKYISKNKQTIAKLKLIRDDENVSMKKRIIAGEKINNLIEEETKRTLQLQDDKIALMKSDLKNTDTLLQDKADIANAEARLNDMDAAASARKRENLMKMNALKKQTNAQELADQKKKIEEEKKKEKELADYIKSLESQTIEYKKAQIENELNVLEDLHEQKLISDEAYLIKKKELEDKYNALSVDATKEVAENKNDIWAQSLAASSQILNAFSSLLDQKMNDELAAAEGNERKQDQIRKKYGEKKKLMAIASIQMDAASAIIATWAAYAAVPIYAGIQTGLIATLAVIESAKVMNTKFAKGGILSGPSHSQGGISTPFGELEGGEGVINARSMSSASLRNLASAANVGGGGNDFSIGDGSISLSSSSIAAITNGINNKKVYVTESDITSTQKNVEAIEQEATL